MVENPIPSSQEYGGNPGFLGRANGSLRHGSSSDSVKTGCLSRFLVVTSQVSNGKNVVV